MITGYNTDIKHGNRVFHVQTEDNGVQNPSIVTLIYVGGEILASKKTSYQERLPLEEKQITELMESQHRRMIAAIKRGKFDGPVLPADPLADEPDVVDAPPMITTTAVSRKTGVVPSEPRPTQTAPSAPPPTGSTEFKPPIPAAPQPPSAVRGSTIVAPPPPASPRPPAPTVGATRPGTPIPTKPREGGSISISDRSLDQVIIDYLANESQSDHLELSAASHGDVFCGDQVELRVATKTAVSQEPIVGAEIIVKIISTVEKPVVAFKGKTTGDGSCITRFKVPIFSEGNAAIIITAASPHGNDELKQLVKRRR